MTGLNMVLLQYIKEAENGRSYELILQEFNYSTRLIDNAIDDLIISGDIFEPKIDIFLAK